MSFSKRKGEKESLAMKGEKMLVIYDALVSLEYDTVPLNITLYLS